MSKCVECNKNEVVENNRCEKCLPLKLWDCKKCGTPINVIQFDNNNGKCDKCK